MRVTSGRLHATQHRQRSDGLLFRRLRIMDTRRARMGCAEVTHSRVEYVVDKRKRRPPASCAVRRAASRSLSQPNGDGGSTSIPAGRGYVVRPELPTARLPYASHSVSHRASQSLSTAYYVLSYSSRRPSAVAASQECHRSRLVFYIHLNAVRRHI